LTTFASFLDGHGDLRGLNNLGITMVVHPCKWVI
jgi:hypothetical protein